MGLSDHEQRVLDELERGLYAEDAKFATKVASGGNPARKLVAGALIAAVGLSVLVFAVIIQLMIIGLVAFALMLAGLVVATSGNSKPKSPNSSQPKANKAPKAPRGGSFFEDRWDKRSGQ